ncbi:pyridoxal phosphate-dependent transferase, partial [Jimgerdemannia flammicorona]
MWSAEYSPSRFLHDVINEQKKAREEYYPTDEASDSRLSFLIDVNFITSTMQSSSAFQENMRNLDKWLKVLNEMLAKYSVPFWSPRYNARMIMDTSLPGNLAYIATMLYNPNNVSSMLSPWTTLVEIEVGKQLCAMLGFNTDPKNKEKPVAWGHITSGGSVANLESVWCVFQMLMNYAVYPLMRIYLRNAIGKTAPLSYIADTFNVELCTGQEKLFKDLSAWELLNLKPSTVLSIPQRLFDEYGISAEYLHSVTHAYSIHTVGKDTLEKQFDIVNPTQYLIGTTKHYSWPKAAGETITGIGSNNVIDVPVDNAARMDTSELDRLLAERLKNQQAVYAVVVIMGSTEQGAVDPLDKVVELRKEYERRGLTFVIHADAAWGGYFASMLCLPLPVGDKDTNPDPDNEFVPTLALQPYTETQIRHYGFCDSITIDPHKSGYIPYPAGGLCYRDERMRYLVTWKSPLVYTSDEEENIGVYGIEGSKPGAAPAAIWLSHSVIGLHKYGYGGLLGEATFTCTK